MARKAKSKVRKKPAKKAVKSVKKMPPPPKKPLNRQSELEKINSRLESLKKEFKQPPPSYKPAVIALVVIALLLALAFFARYMMQ